MYRFKNTTILLPILIHKQNGIWCPTPKTSLEWNMVKIERKRRMIGKAGARTEKMYQRSGRTKREPAEKKK